MKTIKIIILFSLLFFASCYFSTTIFSAQSNTVKVAYDLGNNSCKLQVNTSAGSPAKSVKVSTDVSGGISCVGGRTFYTDSDGRVTLEWSSGCYLKKIFIDGKGHDVNFKDGNSYTISM